MTTTQIEEVLKPIAQIIASLNQSGLVVAQCQNLLTCLFEAVQQDRNVQMVLVVKRGDTVLVASVQN